jgi:hypothetical protein
MFNGKRRLPSRDLKSPFAVKDCKFRFLDISREKEISNSDFLMFNGRRRLPFRDLKSLFGVKDCKFQLLDISRKKEISDSDFPMFNGRRRLPFRDLKSPCAVKDCKLPFLDISRQKEISNNEIEIIKRICWPIYVPAEIPLLDRRESAGRPMRRPTASHSDLLRSVHRKRRSRTEAQRQGM